MAWVNLNMINDGRIVDKAAAGMLDGYEFDILRAGDGNWPLSFFFFSLVGTRKGPPSLVCWGQLLWWKAQAS